MCVKNGYKPFKKKSLRGNWCHKSFRFEKCSKTAEGKNKIEVWKNKKIKNVMRSSSKLRIKMLIWRKNYFLQSQVN